MRILVLTLTIYIPWAHSLKEKRSEVKKLVAKVRNQFNASVSETADQDLHQKITLTVAMIGANTAQIDQMKERVFAFVQKHTQGEIVDEEIQVL